MIDTQSLNKHFKTDSGQFVEALKSVSFQVNEGEFYVLLGPSGSGKTTTLRTVAGLETADTGKMVIDGQTVFSSDDNIILSPEVRPVAMVFQSYALWPHMNVYNNIVFPLRKGMRRVKKPEIKRRVDSVVETLQLGPYLQRPISQLSGGQQQRVALARALALEPSVLLMDEPLSNLDAKLRTQLRVEIKNLAQSLGITTLYVTHDQVEAMVMADRIAVMEYGAIIEEGKPSELYKRPKTEFVAKFLGEMNFVPATLDGSSNASTEGLSTASTPFGSIAIGKTENLGGEKSFKLGFRPEDIHMGYLDKAATFNAQVNKRYYIGDALLCDFTLGEHAFSARLPNTTELQEGEQLQLSIKMSDFSVFRSNA